MMKKIMLVSFLCVAGIGLGAGGAYLLKNYEMNPARDVVENVPQVPVLPTMEELFPDVIPANSTLNTVLREKGLSSQTIHQIVEAAKPVFNLGRINPGVRYKVSFTEVTGTDPDATEIKFRFSPMEFLSVKKFGEVWTAEKISEVVETKVMTFSGTVASSLWESAVQAKMDPNLISELAEVFAWQIDFNREVQADDRWRISVEQKIVKGQPVGWGSILAAEYENQDQKYSGILFQINDQERGYYAPDGTSLKKMFLKSPLRYGRISSRFTTKRFHPILQINRPHLGVDYAAPVGTPIRAVGDGVIEVASVVGGAGKMIKLRHNATYMTAYKHLSGFGKGVRAGSRVRQGQIIGYVGTTGLSTGPHLHFEFYQAGRFVDPLGKKFPSAEPIPSTMLGQFQLELKTMMASLPSWDGVIPGKTGSLQMTE
ncbi:MAG: peptidoglycan DD-metalloendopeptidase family protein [Bdellovibrionaceae bacterium]|nr:peptidoglycan DD-metalloendopeptidase family protein [Pseudobdellovibrionaceae bacterium]